MTDLIGFTLVNATTSTAVLYTGVSATLDLVLVNNTGGPVGLTAAAGSASTLTFYLPDGLFTATQLTGLGVSVSGWTFSVDTGGQTLTLTCSADASWTDGATLTFPVTGAVTTAAPAPAYTIALAPDNLGGNVPAQVNADLAVTLPPIPGNAKLTDVLQLSLDNQGLVYCRSKANVLSNQLVLTLKNIGENPLATASSLVGSPQVIVSFVYGNTSGALAPDTADPTSAWFITGTLQAQPPKAPWTPPGKPTPGKKHPQWVFTPSEGNVTILDGTRTDSANVTFVFSDIVVNPVAGHTQMLVLCTGFHRDATTAYDDHLYVLDINKQEQPSTLGVLAFSAPSPVLAVTDPSKPVPLSLSWTTYGASTVKLIASSPVGGTVPGDCSGPGLLSHDRADVTVDPPEVSQPLFMTLQAYGSTGGYLGSMQYTALLQLSYVQDDDGYTYPVARFGNVDWMLRDYAYPASGSWVYNDVPNPPQGTTRFYTATAAQLAAPSGWTLPSASDWNALVATFGSTAYTALTVGGASLFEAQLTGLRLNGTYQNFGQSGYYWCAGSNPLTQFRSSASSVDVAVPWSNQVEGEFAVRYVRHA